MRETREQFLEWAKGRALQYVDAGEFRNAFASMGSDLRKNPEVYDASAPGVKLAIQAGMYILLRGPTAQEVRDCQLCAQPSATGLLDDRDDRQPQQLMLPCSLPAMQIGRIPLTRWPACT